MSFTNILSGLEAKVAQAQNMLKSNSSTITEIMQQMEKLAAEKNVSHENIKYLTGVIHAYTDVSAFIKGNPVPLLKDVAEGVVNAMTSGSASPVSAEIAAPTAAPTTVINNTITTPVAKTTTKAK